MSVSNSPWWRQYRLRKYKPPVKLNIEMILRKSIVDAFTEYLKHVSLHSVKWVTEAPLSILARLLRVCIFLTMIVWALFNLHYVVVDFMENPLIVSTENDAYPISELDFPAVALCNINRISKKAALKYAEFVIPKLKEPYTNFNEPELMVYFIEELGRLIDFKSDVSNSNPNYVKVEEMFDIEPHEVADVMAQLSPKCEELLVACFWASRPVDCKEIFSVRRTILGHCCMFNYELDTNLAFQKPNVSLSNIKHQAVPGDMSGLAVVVDIQSDDYDYPLTAMEGVEVLIFDPTHFPEYNGGGGVIQGYVQAEEFASFSLQSVKQYATHEVRKQRLQNRKCLFKDERPDEYGNMYSYSTCLMKCRLKAIQSLCKCNPYFYPVSVADGPMCTLHDVPCLNRYREKFMYLYPMDAKTTEGLETEIQDSLYCPDCYPDCEFTKHRVMMSKLAWNINEHIHHLFYNGVMNKTEGSNTHDIAIISIHQSSPDAVLDRLDVVNYWFEIISSVGGEISILIGITNLNYVELIYFLTIRLYRITVHNYKKYH